MSYSLDILDYDEHQDLSQMIQCMSNYQKANHEILEIRLSKEIFTHWANTNDPLVTGFLDPVARVSDMETGWLGTMLGIKLTGTMYVPPHLISHLLPLPEWTYAVFSRRLIQQTQDLVNLAKQVASP